jgi:tetratricopeptide (TPR) repeat protein
MYRLAGQYDKAQQRFDQALEIFQQMDTRWQIGRTLFELGELAITQTNIVAARENFAQALNAFEVIGAASDIERTGEKLNLMQEGWKPE